MAARHVAKVRMLWAAGNGTCKQGDQAAGIKLKYQHRWHGQVNRESNRCGTANAMDEFLLMPLLVCRMARLRRGVCDSVLMFVWSDRDGYCLSP